MSVVRRALVLLAGLLGTKKALYTWKQACQTISFAYLVVHKSQNIPFLPREKVHVESRKAAS